MLTPQQVGVHMEGRDVAPGQDHKRLESKAGAPRLACTDAAHHSSVHGVLPELPGEGSKGGEGAALEGL